DLRATFKLGPLPRQAIEQLRNPLVVFCRFRTHVLIPGQERFGPQLHLWMALLKADRGSVLWDPRQLNLPILLDPQDMVSCRIIAPLDEFAKLFLCRVVVQVHSSPPSIAQAASRRA